MSKSKTKTFIVAHDIYTGEKHHIVVATASDVDVPVITEKNYVFVNLDRNDGSLTVLNDLGEEIGFQIKNARVLAEFINTLDEYEKSGQDLSLVVTTVCSMGLEEPSRLQVEEEEHEAKQSLDEEGGQQ